MHRNDGGSLPLFDWQPPEKVALFPSTRRRALIISTARRASENKDPNKLVKSVIDRTRTSRLKLGLSAAVIDADLRDFEVAIRAHLARFLNERGRSA